MIRASISERLQLCSAPSACARLVLDQAGPTETCGERRWDQEEPLQVPSAAHEQAGATETCGYRRLEQDEELLQALSAARLVQEQAGATGTFLDRRLEPEGPPRPEVPVPPSLSQCRLWSGADF